jgi:hypothetical protein
MVEMFKLNRFMGALSSEYLRPSLVGGMCSICSIFSCDIIRKLYALQCKFILTAVFLCIFGLNYAEDVPLAEESLPQAMRIEDYLDPYDEGAFEELEEYYNNLSVKKSACSLTETVHSNEGGSFFFFYSIDEKYKSLRRRCKILVFLLLMAFLWSFAEKRFQRRTISLSGI